MDHQRDTRGVSELATRQNGNVTHAQLRAHGYSPEEIRQCCDAGWLIRRHTGIYAVGHVPAPRASAWHAAVLALGDGAILSHTSAAAHWDMRRPTAVIEVIVPTTAGFRKRDGVIVHRQPLPAAHMTVHRGIPVTTPTRTLLDLAAVVPYGALASAFEQAQVRLKLPPAPLAADVISRPRQRGNAKLRRILSDAVDPADVRSVLELRFLRMCAFHGIPRPLVNVRLGDWTPDFLWPDHGLVVETDGAAFHRTAASRRRDALKDEVLRGLGLTVIRLTWAQVTERPAETARRVLDHHECRLDGPMTPRGDIRA